MKERLVAIARAAIGDCAGDRLVEEALRERALGVPAGDPVWVAGAGKAVGGMAAGALRVLGEAYRPGPLVGKDLAATGARASASPSIDRLPGPLRPFFRVASHPIPDERGVAATHELLAFLASRAPHEPVLFLLSGGASSLLGAPLAGLPLAAWQSAQRRLLASGLGIRDVNIVRRHLGLALGGRLALSTRAPLSVLALSDVIGDDPALIGSGPASVDDSTFADALAIARRASLDEEALRLLERGARGELPATPRPGDPRLARVAYRIVATPERLLARAAERALERGLRPLVEERLVADDVEALAERYARRFDELSPGEVLVAVGEPTVRVRGRGRGGRAQHLAGLLSLALAGRDFAFVALGSDGSDGPTDAAGAAVDGRTLETVRGAGEDLASALAENDAYPPLSRAGALVSTGATDTNLLDVHLLARGRG